MMTMNVVNVEGTTVAVAALRLRQVMVKLTDHQMTKGLSHDELATLTTNTVAQLETLTDALTHDEWAGGEEWYQLANQLCNEWALDHGLRFDYVAGIIAALSPQIQWEVNLADAQSILKDGERASTAAFGPNVVKALWILDGTDPESELGGRKVRSFYQNIAYPYHSLDVTLDSWMAGMLGHNPKFLERKGTYDAISDAFRIVAERHCVLPHQLQAALWIGANGKTNINVLTYGKDET